MIHCCAPKPIPKSRLISGRATLIAVTEAIEEPRTVAMSIRRRQAASVSGCCGGRGARKKAPPGLRRVRVGAADSRSCGLLLQAAQQQMEVDEACIGCPAEKRGARALLAARRGQKTAQAVERTDVALREDVQSSQAAQQDVVRAPAPDAGAPDERPNDCRVV